MRSTSSKPLWVLLLSSLAMAGCSEEEGSTLDAGSDTGTGDTGKVDTGTGDTGTGDTSTGDTGTGDTGAADTTTDAPTDSTADSTADSSADSATDSTTETGEGGTTKTKTVWALQIGDGTVVADKASGPIQLVPFTIDYTGAPTGAAAGTSLKGAITGSDAISLPISSSIGALALSGNGKLASFAAYRAVPGTAAIADTAASATKRVAVTVNASGTFTVADLGAAANDAGGSIRSAYTTDGAQFWVGAEDKGVTYNVGTTATNLATANMRWVGAFGGQLYVTAGSGSGALSGIGPGLVQVGTGLPTAAATLAKVNGPVTGNSPYGFAGFDTDATAGVDTLLLCDTGSSSKGLQKWRLEGTTWALKATHLSGVTGGCQGLVAWVDGTDLVVAVTTGETPPKLVVLRDPIASVTALTAGTTVATAPTNAVFKGLAAAPAP